MIPATARLRPLRLTAALLAVVLVLGVSAG